MRHTKSYFDPFVLFFIFTLPPITAIRAENRAQVNPDTPYNAQKSDPITHDVEFSVIVTPPYHCKVLKVWVPIPQSDSAQEIEHTQFKTFPDQVKPQISSEPVYGNRFAFFEFHNPHGAQIITHRFQAKVWNLNWKLQPETVATIPNWPDPFAPYLKPQTIQDQQQFQLVLKQIGKETDHKSPGLMQVMNWIDQNLTYDHINASLQADANHALTKRRGHCSDYHGLCATMGRAMGYPTRVTYGLGLYPKNSPSHCKMEAFLPPYGWVSFDISETQKLVKSIQSSSNFTPQQKQIFTAAARHRLRSGFRENSWLLLTKGTDYELAPPASKPVRIVRTAYVEADGIALPEPDPANINQREFSWMTAHRYTADKTFKKPFKDLSTLDVD